MEKAKGTLSLLQAQINRRKVNFVIHNGERYRTFPAAQEVCGLLSGMQQRFCIPRNRLPLLAVPGRDTPGMEDMHAGYDSRANVVFIPEDAWLGTGRDHYQLGDKIGEELFGHCCRCHSLFRCGGIPGGRFPLEGKVERGDVEEFFGYLGRKNFLRMAQEHGLADIFFPKGKVTPPKHRDRVNEEINDLRRQLNDWLMPGKSLIKSEIDEKEAHAEGYRWAHALDISGIPWDRMAKLYSLPTEEVVRRFFHGKPDLSGFGSSVDSHVR